MPVTEAGQRKMRDLVLEGMTTRGLEEVPCVEFVLQDDSIVQVLTENHPILDRPASDAKSMKFKTSAEAGRGH